MHNIYPCNGIIVAIVKEEVKDEKAEDADDEVDPLGN